MIGPDKKTALGHLGERNDVLLLHQMGLRTTIRTHAAQSNDDGQKKIIIADHLARERERELAFTMRGPEPYKQHSF